MGQGNKIFYRTLFILHLISHKEFCSDRLNNIFYENDRRRGRQKKKMKRKKNIQNKSETTNRFLDPQNPMLETNFNFLSALDQKLYWKTCFRVMAKSVNGTAYVARTDRSRFYCIILCPRIRSTMCRNMVTFCPAASELDAKMYQVTLSVYRSRLKVKVTKKLNQICALMSIVYVWSFRTTYHVVCQEPWTQFW